MSFAIDTKYIKLAKLEKATKEMIKCIDFWSTQSTQVGAIKDFAPYNKLKEIVKESGDSNVV